MRAEFLRQKLSNDKFCPGGWSRALSVYEGVLRYFNIKYNFHRIYFFSTADTFSKDRTPFRDQRMQKTYRKSASLANRTLKTFLENSCLWINANGRDYSSLQRKNKFRLKMPKGFRCTSVYLNMIQKPHIQHQDGSVEIGLWYLAEPTYQFCW